mgnify:CR=1 FL=1
MKEWKIDVEYTREMVEDLRSHYGIDAAKELEDLLAIELKKALEITEENLREDGWEIGTSQSSGKKVWILVKFSEESFPPIKTYEYDPDEETLTHRENKLKVKSMIEIRFFLATS